MSNPKTIKEVENSIKNIDQVEENLGAYVIILGKVKEST